MMENSNSTLDMTNNHQPFEEDIPAFNYKKLTGRLIANWYWFIICLLLGLAVAWYYNRYTTPVYAIKSSMLIQEKSSNSFLSQNRGISGQIFQGFGTDHQGIYNQMVILKSKPLITMAVSELNMEVSYYRQERFAKHEIYNDAPFRIIWDKKHPQLVNLDFSLSVMPNRKIKLVAEDEDVPAYNYSMEKWVNSFSEIKIDKLVESGEIIAVPGYYSFKVVLNEDYNPEERANFIFKFSTIEQLVNSYRGRLTIELIDWESSIVDMKLKDYNQQKGMDFLNKLARVYQLDNMERKNRYADKTIEFIDVLLQGVSDSLNVAERELLSFQARNKIVDISAQSSQMLQQMSSLDQDKIQLETQKEYYKYLQDYIQKNKDIEDIMAPSSVGINDPLLTGLIARYNELAVEKSKMANVRVAPRLMQINTQMENIKSAMLENISNIMNQTDVALNEIDKRSMRIESRVRQLPVTEQNFVNIERKYNLNNETYTFLLEKLSEAQIAKASNQPESQIVEMAESQGLIAPKENKIYSYGAMGGLAFPALIILIIVIMNNKVVSKDDVENITRLPLLSLVFYNKKDNHSLTPVLDNPNTVASEPYRSLRHKLKLMVKGKEKPVIAVTSTAPGEGKTYTAVNIASSFALAQKRAVMVDFDLRNSMINKNFGIDKDIGVVSYILGEHDIDEITIRLKHPNISIVPAGPLPPNPGEMLMDPKVLILMEELKKKFDVIVIDSAPIGHVNDLFQITEQVDSILFVVRDNFTNRSWLRHAIDEIKAFDLKNVGVVINAVKLKKSKFLRYGYGYGYGYGKRYGYGYGKKREKEMSYTEKVSK
jgi:tyrosine-protein kinase Etk/Wzc